MVHVEPFAETFYGTPKKIGICKAWVEGDAYCHIAFHPVWPQEAYIPPYECPPVVTYQKNLQQEAKNAKKNFVDKSCLWSNKTKLTPHPTPPEHTHTHTFYFLFFFKSFRINTRTFPCQKDLVKGEKSKWPTSWQKRSITPQPHGSSAKLVLAQMQRRSFHEEDLAVLKNVHAIIFHFLSIQVLPWWPIYLRVIFVLNGQLNACWFQFIYNKCFLSTIPNG